MDFRLSDDQLAFQETARKFARDVFVPNAARWDEEKHFPVEELREAAALGFAGMYVSPDFDGTGLGRLDSAIILEELAAGCTSTAAYISIHNMVAAMIDRYGGEAVKKKFLPKLCTMDWFASYCLTEPSSGSDAASLRTKAVRDGEHYVLNGSKAFISGGGRADVYAIMARTGEDGPKGISCILVEKGTPGLSFGAQEKKLGWNSQPTSAVILEDCRVPVTNRLGAEGEGFKIAMTGLDGGRINIGACSLGAARASLEIATDYVQTRTQFNQTLAGFQSVQFKLADMATQIEAARQLIFHAAALKDAGLPCLKEASMAKLFASTMAERVCSDAIQIHGGYGYVSDFPVERIYRDVRVSQIYEGASDIQRLVIAREVTKV